MGLGTRVDASADDGGALGPYRIHVTHADRPRWSEKIAFGRGLPRIKHRRQWIDCHLDASQCLASPGRRVGGDDGQGMAHVMNPIHGQQGFIIGHDSHLILSGDVRCRQNACYAWRCQGSIDLQPTHNPVGRG